MARLKNVKFKYRQLYHCTYKKEETLLRFMYTDYEDSFVFEIYKVLKGSPDRSLFENTKWVLSRDFIAKQKIRFRNARPSEIILYGKKHT